MSLQEKHPKAEQVAETEHFVAFAEELPAGGVKFRLADTVSSGRETSYEHVVVQDDEIREFVETLDDAGLLPDEYTPDEESVEDLLEEQEPYPSPSPEDVADTWIEAKDRLHEPAYAPLNDDTEVSFNPSDWSNQYRVESGHLHTPNGKSDHWNAHTLRTVDAAGVPFSEVPADE